MTPDEKRQEIFDESAVRLSEMAYRAINVLGLDPSEVATVAINVDDPAWTDLAEKLMPGHDWQSYRDRGELPIARGSVMWGAAEYICTVCPALSMALETAPPEGHLYAFVMDGGGASLFVVPYTGMEA
jgi:hypothetical protein